MKKLLVLASLVVSFSSQANVFTFCAKNPLMPIKGFTIDAQSKTIRMNYNGQNFTQSLTRSDISPGGLCELQAVQASSYSTTKLSFVIGPFGQQIAPKGICETMNFDWDLAMRVETLVEFKMVDTKSNLNLQIYSKSEDYNVAYELCEKN